MAKKICRIHYRRLDRGDATPIFPSEPLSERIQAALNASGDDGHQIKSSVRHRVTGVPTAPEYQRALNNYAIGDGYVFGTTCLYAPGQMQALLKLDADEAQPTLAAVLEAYDIAEQKAPAGHEYLHGLSYWLAIGDHFYQIQSISLQSGAMEEYLTWLLAEKAKVIEPDHYVKLIVTFDAAQLEGDDPSFIQIGGIVPETLRSEDPAELPAPNETIVESVEHERLGGANLSWATARKVLDDIYGTIKAEELINGVPDEASLEVSVSIGYRSRKRKLQKSFMKDLASGLRNLPDGQVTIRSKNGSLKGADARIFVDLGVTKLDGTSGLLVLDNARDQMLEAHRRLLHDGKIEP